MDARLKHILQCIKDGTYDPDLSKIALELDDELWKKYATVRVIGGGNFSSPEVAKALYIYARPVAQREFPDFFMEITVSEFAVILKIDPKKLLIHTQILIDDNPTCIIYANMERIPTKEDTLDLLKKAGITYIPGKDTKVVVSCYGIGGLYEEFFIRLLE